MTALSASHGSKADFYIGTSGSPLVPVQISQYGDTSGLSFSRDKAEVSAFKNLFKAYVAGLADLTVPLGGPADVNITGQLWNLFTMSNAGSNIEFQYAPLGYGVTGSPLWTGTGFLTKYEEKVSTGAAWTWTGEFQGSSTSGPVRTIQ